jgi:peptide/nickel transport system substrate-binding protein
VRAARLIGLTALALALGGCPGGGGGDGSALEGGTIRVEVPATQTGVDPALALPETGSGAQPLLLAYTPPLAYRHAEGRDGTELVPALAARVPEPSGHGRVYTLRLRAGLLFSNGRAVRPSDVRHTILRARALSPVGGQLFAGVRRLVADDARGTLRIVLRRSDPSFPHALASAQAGVVPVAAPMEAAHRPPAGVGPYRIVRVRPGRGYVLQRDREFSLRGVAPGLLDEIAVVSGDSVSEQTDAVMADRLDVMTVPPPADRRPELRSELRERYLEEPALETRYLQIRVQGDGSADLRDALAIAMDRPEAARRLGGLVNPTCSLLPPALPGAGEPESCPWGDPEDHPDLVKARKLVEDAGALGRRVTVAAGPGDKAAARLYGQTLATLGLSPRRVDGRAEVTLLRARAPVPDAARFLVPLAERVPLVLDAEALLTADELRTTTDEAERAKLARTLDEDLVEGGVIVPYAQSLGTVFVSGRIDATNCLNVHPVAGVDLVNLCLR